MPGKAITLANKRGSPEHFRSQQAPDPPGRCSQPGSQSPACLVLSLSQRKAREFGLAPRAGERAARHPKGRPVAHSFLGPRISYSPFPAWGPSSLPGALAGVGPRPLQPAEALGPIHFQPLLGLLHCKPLCSWAVSKTHCLDLPDFPCLPCLQGQGCQSQPLSALCPSPSSSTPSPPLSNPAAPRHSDCCVPAGPPTRQRREARVS